MTIGYNWDHISVPESISDLLPRMVGRSTFTFLQCAINACLIVHSNELDDIYRTSAMIGC